MLIVITSPDKIVNESELLNQLFSQGLEILHLRKPLWAKTDFEALLKSINPEHKRKVVLHQFHELAAKYNVKGLHLREENRKQLSVSELKELSKEIKRKNLTFSSSVHSIEDVVASGNVFDYVFLSPVFDSISKPGYVGSKFNVQSLKCETKVIALGGIDLSNIYKTKELGYDGAAVLGAVWRKSEMAIEKFSQIKIVFATPISLYYETARNAKGNLIEVANTHVGDERTKNMAIAFFLADKGYWVRLLHNNITDKVVFDKIMPRGSKYPKHADALVNNDVFEFKTNVSGTIKSLKNDIKAGGRQASKIIVRFDTEEHSNKSILKGITGEMLAFKHIKSVWILKNSNLLKFERKYVIKKNP